MEPLNRFRLTKTIYIKQLHYYIRNNALIHMYITSIKHNIKYEVNSLSVSENFIRLANNINTLNKHSLRITQKMRVQDIIVEKEVNEAPVGLLKQVGRKLGAKAASAVGMKGTAAKLSGAAEVGDEARQLKVALQGYAGKTGINIKQMQGPQLAAFLKSKGYPNMHLQGVQGIMTPKQIDQAIMTAAQDAAKADGDGTAGTSQAPSQPSAPAAGAAKGTNVAGKPTTAQAPQVDKNKDGKDDATGEPMGAKVIPMKKPGAGITPEMQKQLDALTPTEKKVLAGAI
ncbi:hypothetical protein PQZ46_00985 [bacterium]|nr:hypothetical protein [bacterium]